MRTYILDVLSFFFFFFSYMSGLTGAPARSRCQRDCMKKKSWEPLSWTRPTEVCIQFVFKSKRQNILVCHTSSGSTGSVKAWNRSSWDRRLVTSHKKVRSLRRVSSSCSCCVSMTSGFSSSSSSPSSSSSSSSSSSREWEADFFLVMTPLHHRLFRRLFLVIAGEMKVWKFGKSCRYKLDCVYTSGQCVMPTTKTKQWIERTCVLTSLIHFPV